MEALAENRIIINKKMFYEGMLRISRDGYGRSARKGVLVLVGLWLALLAYTLISGGNLGQTMSYLILVAIMSLWLCVYLPRYSAGRAWKSQTAKYGESIERVTYFYPEQLLIAGEGLEKQVPYTDIVRMMHSRKLLILICRDKTAVLLAKDGFSRMNEHEITALIQGPQHKE